MLCPNLTVINTQWSIIYELIICIIPVGTFDVINASITRHTNSSICIKCIFSSSVSEGCTVILLALGTMASIIRDFDIIPGEHIAHK